MKKIKSLRDAVTLEEICNLKRDNFSYGDYWLLSDGYNVTIAKQKFGDIPEGSCTIPRRHFNELIDRYQKEQK